MNKKSASPKHWVGDMEADYIYTTGIAGDRFFKTLRDKGKLSATCCKKCDITYIPPRMYCENCFEELTTWKELEPKGIVETFTIANIDEKNKKLGKPRVWAFIKVDGTDGGLVHNLGDIDPEDIKLGMRVEAVLKPQKERKGEITDILYFRPKK